MTDTRPEYLCSKATATGKAQVPTFREQYHRWCLQTVLSQFSEQDNGVTGSIKNGGHKQRSGTLLSESITTAMDTIYTIGIFIMAADAISAPHQWSLCRGATSTAEL